MALFGAAAARRTATSSLPLLRASVSRGGIALLRPLAAAAARPMPFSSATGVKPSSGDELSRVINSETKVSQHCGGHEPVRSAEDDKNSTLSSDKSSPSVDESSSSSVRNQEGEGKNHTKQLGFRYRCVCMMGDDSSVKCSCTIYPSQRKMVIHALALRPPPPFDEESDEELDFTDFEEAEADFTKSKEDDLTESEEDDLTKYEADYFSESEEVVEFSKLDVKLQLALYKVVTLKGYHTPEITELLQEPTTSKDQARTLFWETKLWDFVNKDAMPESFHDVLKESIE